MLRLVNFVAFQAAWFACVLGAANQMPWLGLAVVAGVLAFHLLSATRPGTELTLVAAVAGIGMVWDSVLVAAGLMTYPSGTMLPWLAPYWIFAMWVAFATTLNMSLRWLHGRWLLASLLGAVAGPAAYYGGSALGGVVFADTGQAMLAQSLGWMLLMPLLVAVAQRLDGARDISAPASDETLIGASRHV